MQQPKFGNANLLNKNRMDRLCRQSNNGMKLEDNMDINKKVNRFGPIALQGTGQVTTFQSRENFWSRGPASKRSTSPALSVVSVASSADSWCKKYEKKRSTPNDKLKNVNVRHTWRASRPTDIKSDFSDDSDDEGKARFEVKKGPKDCQNYKRADLTQLKDITFSTFETATTDLGRNVRWSLERKDFFGLSEGVFCGNRVATKYLHLPKDPSNVNLDLNIMQPEDLRNFPVNINENINEITMWVMDNFPKPTSFEHAYPDVGFVCSRLELDHIMSIPYLHDKTFDFEHSFGFIISAVKVKGKIYLSTFYTDEEKSIRAETKEFKGAYLPLNSSTAGFMFLKHVLSNGPNELPKLDVPFNRRESELYSVDKVTVGDHVLLVQNKFKAIRSEEELEEFSKYKMFELKTATKPYKLRNMFPKLLRCLAGNISSTIIGVRSNNCKKIEKIEELSQEELLQICTVLKLASSTSTSTSSSTCG
ncbi:uncharacterized protein LOC132205071 isoform X2 [Neocloeon triangulifer]|uniref:uncharacterized protein LOC132205071 isoform X2 n=2 Tax=Neocloeon triangulifer TaxID=2078957 RepID=UPI00286F5DDB|nr:uncharacterized protein LOC132205071 isoform X2 [Neocloeon triangulifer]